MYINPKFIVQVPADGVGGIIIRSLSPAVRVTEEYAWGLAERLRQAHAQIVSRRPAARTASIVPDLTAKRSNPRDWPAEETVLAMSVLDMEPAAARRKLKAALPHRSDSMISSKLQRLRAARSRAQNSALPPHRADGQPHSAEGNVGGLVERRRGGAEDAGRVLQPVPTRPADSVGLALGNDEGSPASELQREIDNLREQVAAKDELIERLRRARNSDAVTHARSWTGGPGAAPQLATTMPDTGPIPWPSEQDRMKGR